jgi:ferric-dicitrate binding protein FerR (iron transport regulator)
MIYLSALKNISMKKERSAYLFQKYIDKDCSAAEKAELFETLNQADQTPYFEEMMDKLWDKTNEVVLEDDKAAEIFNKAIAAGGDFEEGGKTSAFKMWWAWAAAIVIIGFAGLLMINRPNQQSNLAKVKPQPNSMESVVERTLDEHKKVTLPDGSTVILNNNSTITYQKDFKGTQREVILKGEGYFDIKHNDHKAFIVHTGKLRTTVLGTAFNIKAYDLDKDIEVTVTRGKVSVLNDQSVLGIITPNQQIVYNKDIKKSGLTKVVAKSIVQWQENDIFFDDVTMEEAAQLLSKRFSTGISFSNEKAKKCKFTATFLKGESLEEILKVICPYNNAQYQITANGITIKGEGCE